jgi:hypothetical protein
MAAVARFLCGDIFVDVPKKGDAGVGLVGVM